VKFRFILVILVYFLCRNTLSASPVDPFAFRPRIDSAVNSFYKQQSDLWFFARLYQEVSNGIDNLAHDGQFEDSQFVRRIENTFGYYYFTALDSFTRNGALTAGWQQAFDTSACAQYGFIQVLVLSINAHINHDLYLGLREIFKKTPPEKKHLRDYDKVSKQHERIAYAFITNLIKRSPNLSSVQRKILMKAVKKAKKEIRRERMRIWKMAAKGAKSERKHKRYYRKQLRKAKRYAKRFQKPKGLIKAGFDASQCNSLPFFQRSKLLDM